jgi:two-component system chemotaxis sensor kinase CheA
LGFLKYLTYPSQPPTGEQNLAAAMGGIMTPDESILLTRLRATFKVEAEEHLRTVSAGIIQLERSDDPAKRMETIETIYREAHSLKGAARSVNLSQVESIAQSLEGIFGVLRHSDAATTPELLDLLHQALDRLSGLLAADPASPPTHREKGLETLLRRLHAVAGGQPPRAAPGQPPVETPAQPATGLGQLPSTERVRVDKAKLESILLQAEELLAVKLAMGQRAAELREASDDLAALKKIGRK